MTSSTADGKPFRGSGYVGVGKNDYEHRQIAARALGRPLRRGEEVHHVDRNKRRNVGGNLVICNTAYHRLIESRAIALAATGNANARRCGYCKVFDDPANLSITSLRSTPSGKVYHKACAAAYRRHHSQ